MTGDPSDATVPTNPNPFSRIPPMPSLSGDVFTVESLPRIIAEALDAADKRREERVLRQAATQNLEGMRKNFAGQIEVLERLSDECRMSSGAIGAREAEDLAAETSGLLRLIDDKLAVEIAANADMIRESLRQARAAIEGRAAPGVQILPPGAKLIKNAGKRR